MEYINGQVGGKLYSSRADRRAFSYLFNQLDDRRDGVYDTKDTERDIKIYGWSWGGVTAVKLARLIKDDKKFSVCRKAVKILAVIDPDDLLYWADSQVPDNVKRIYNWYQTAGEGGKPRDSHGDKLEIQDKDKTVGLQSDFNVTGEETTTNYPFPGNRRYPINHHTIIWHVESEIIGVLR